MSSLSIGISIDIIDYYPKDYDYTAYTFIFISEENNFEREISFINSNQICHKITFPNKKEIKYSIKVLKDDSLIGISELIIPNQIIYKKEKIYDKICPINMTDSTKKILFGNASNSIVLKIGIHCTLQYIEEKKNLVNVLSKKENKTFLQKSKINKKKERIRIFTPPSHVTKNFPKMTNSSSAYKENFQTISLKNDKSMINYQNRKADSFILQKNSKNKNNKKHKRTYSLEKQDHNITKIKSLKNKILLKKESKNTITDINKENINDISKEENKEDNKIKNNDIIELKNDFENFINENSKKINYLNNDNDMNNFTVNNIKKILDYQTKNYELIKDKIISLNQRKEQYIKVNEKYKQNLSIKNKLIEKNNEYDIQKELLINKEKELDLQNKEISELKNIESNIFKEIYSNINQNNSENNENKNEDFSLLFKVLKIISKKYGQLQNLLTQTNSIESQRTTLKNLLIKYKTELDLKD